MGSRISAISSPIAALDQTSHPGDPVSAIFAERCAHLKEVGVPEDWNGIWVMKTK